MRRAHVQPMLLLAGLGAWAYGVSRLEPSTIGSYGVLGSCDGWFALGLAVLLAGFVIELAQRRPRRWMLGLQLVALIVAIHSTVPIIYRAPEYGWVYKHVGIADLLGLHGHVTDSSSIYQEWPALFAGVAAISALGHVGPLSFATWAPLAFELADALLLVAVFRLLTDERRVVYLAVLLYEGLISWVGQDYLSPQAFGYLLWLGLILIVLRWLRAPADASRGSLARLRAPLLVGLREPAQTPAAMRALAVVLVAVIYFAIVAAHQLTPYVALAAVSALTALGLVRPRWLVALLALIAAAYLVPRYSLIAHDFGGLFSGGNPIQNASGLTHAHSGSQALNAAILRGLAACTWVLALASVARSRAALGRVAIPTALAFSPFVILGFQSYGGEAIYRVYLFSAPWCALLIASMLSRLRAPAIRWSLAGGACAAALAAGLQGLYGPVEARSFTPAEVTASRWLYAHVPPGALIVLPVDNFPAFDAANYDKFDVQVIPADPQFSAPPLIDEADLPEVERWMAGSGRSIAYVVVSRSMRAYVDFYGAPAGYLQLARTIPGSSGWSLFYRNANATIYRLALKRTETNGRARAISGAQVHTPRSSQRTAVRPAAYVSLGTRPRSRDMATLGSELRGPSARMARRPA